MVEDNTLVGSLHWSAVRPGCEHFQNNELEPWVLMMPKVFVKVFRYGVSDPQADL